MCTIPDTNVSVNSPSGSETGKNIHWYIALDADRSQPNVIHSQFFNFNLFCIRLIHRGYDPLDMELVNTENKVTNIIHDVRYLISEYS
jgi:hypothetical protein